MGCKRPRCRPTDLGAELVQTLTELPNARGARVLWVGPLGGGVARYNLDAIWSGPSKTLAPIDDKIGQGVTAAGAQRGRGRSTVPYSAARRRIAGAEADADCGGGGGGGSRTRTRTRIADADRPRFRERSGWDRRAHCALIVTGGLHSDGPFRVTVRSRNE
jgi:hypothetical protein